MRRLAPYALAAFAALVVLWFAARGAARPRPAHVASLAELEHALEPGAEVVFEREDPPDEATNKPRTARQTLAEYYGKDWNGIEARMEAAGVDLEVPFDAPPPWASVADVFRAQVRVDEGMRRQIAEDRLGWTENLSNDWLRKEFPGAGDFELGPAELAELEALVAPDGLEFEVVCQAFCDRLDYHLRAAFEQDRILRAPFTTQGLETKPGLYSTAIAGHGWGVTVTLEAETCPDVVELERDLSAVTHRRDRTVARFLRAHARR